jgi:predicted membrane protein
MPGVDGFMYPNEVELQWSVLIVLYPFITGLVAGAFILASLERVFNVQAVKPTYRLALLTALAFLLVAPLPLQMHLGHPERSLEMMFTPHTTSAMAMFGFVYLWYLMVVLLVEIWLEYRRELVLAARGSSGLKRLFYRPSRWVRTTSARRHCASTIRSDGSSRSSEFRRRSCSTGTSASSLVQSKRIRGGRRR